MKESKVLEDQWKLLLVGQLSKSHQDRVSKCIADDDATYGDIVRTLGNVEDDTYIKNILTPIREDSRDFGYLGPMGGQGYGTGKE